MTRLAYVVCNTCGMPGPEGGTDEAAHMLALKYGWEVREIELSSGTITVYTCPDCQPNEDIE